MDSADPEGALSCDECDLVMAFEISKQRSPVVLWARLCAAHVGPWMMRHSVPDEGSEFSVVQIDGSV